MAIKSIGLYFSDGVFKQEKKAEGSANGKKGEAHAEVAVVNALISKHKESQCFFLYQNAFPCTEKCHPSFLEMSKTKDIIVKVVGDQSGYYMAHNFVKGASFTADAPVYIFYRQGAATYRTGPGRPVPPNGFVSQNTLDMSHYDFHLES